MKAISILLLLAYAQLTVSDTLESGFAEWKKTFGKTYASTEAEDKAFSTWKVNKALVDKANSGKSLFTAGVGKFADMTNEEFASKMLLRKASAKFMSEIQPAKITKKAANLPTSFDWRSNDIQNIVTSVKDQGTVGSCWAFSTIGNIEGQWARAGHTLTDLSAEFLVDCDGTHDDEHADCSVFGGWPYLAYDFIISSDGVPSEASYPYCSGTGDCYPCMLGPISLCGPPPYSCNKTITEQCPYAAKTAVISDWSSVSTEEDDIASTLYSTGPLSVLLDASQLQYYQGGIWTGHLDSVSPYLGCHSDSLDHAVLLVGYGVDGATGTKYWIVKNSWGTNWGEDGYFRIVRGTGLCGINTAVTTSIV